MIRWIQYMEKNCLDITGFVFWLKNTIFYKCHKFDLNFVNVRSESLKMLSSLNNRQAIKTTSFLTLLSR